MKKPQACGGVLAAGLLVATVPVAAQDQSDERIDEIVVTGSRVLTPGTESSSPVLTVGAEEIARQQVADIEKVVRGLPAAIPGDNPGANNGSAGVTTINFRGLGPNRNLVLMDGKRMVPYNTSGFVDVSQVPVELLERMDVVTGGASAVYGSDAMSGVVNFVMKRNYEGVALSFDGAQTAQGDGGIYTVGATFGANLAEDRGNVALHLNYSKREPMLFNARSFGVVNIDSQSGASSDREGGSFTTIPTMVFGNVSGYQAGDGATLEDVFDSAGNPTPAFRSFNFNPFNYYQTPQSRWSAMATGHMEIASHAEAYARLLFTNSEVNTQLAPSGTFGFNWQIPIANPYLSNQARNLLCDDANLPFNPDPAGYAPAGCNDQDVTLGYYRRTTEIGPRTSEFDGSTHQMVFGVSGRISENWNYDVSYQHGEVKRQIRFLNDLNGVNMQQALLADNETTCRDNSNGCVPINMFGEEGSITPAMAAFVRLNLLSDEIYTQDVASAYVSGSPAAFKLPTADRALSFALGLEYRKEHGEVRPDSNLSNAAIPVGFGPTSPIDGGFEVKEAYTELLVPLLGGKPFADSLDLQLGYRYSEYDLSGNTDTWRAGLSWAPVQSLRLRAELQRAVRAPNVGELFQPVTFGTGNLALDPCAGAAPTTDAGLAALCVATGAPQARVDSGSIPGPISGQVNNFVGGNLALSPETGDTLTYGFVFAPTAEWGRIRNPVLTVDYYDIQIEDAINVPALADVVNGCYSAALNPTREFNDLCALIVRNDINGSLSGNPPFGVTTLAENLALQEVEGIDFSASFGVDFESAGRLDVEIISNYYLKNAFRNSALSPLNECAGAYGQNCGTATGGPVNKLRVQQRSTWTRNALELGYLWRYQSGAHVEASTPVLPQFAHVSSYSYFDLTAAWHFDERIVIRAGVSNLFDKDPPFVGGTAADTTSNGGNTFPGAYDVLGRTFLLGAKLSF
jgi:outer membrane receptor protein involved in Fe transport